MAPVVRSMLVVDDDEDLRELMKEITSSMGVEEHVVAGGLRELEGQREAALRCALAILDVNLGPGAPTGVDVHHWLRREGFDGRIVFLTGHAEHDPRVRAAAEIPGTRVLRKPIGMADLAKVLERT